MNRLETDSSHIVKLAIACFGEVIAPRFAVARHFRLWEFMDGYRFNTRDLIMIKMGSFARISMLKQVGVNCLICNGIEKLTRSMLESYGCEVIEGVNCAVETALTKFVSGTIGQEYAGSIIGDAAAPTNRKYLAKWTHRTLNSSGWSGEEVVSHPFLVDMIATKQIQGKLCRIAVSYGGHIYCVNKEIREFSSSTSNGFYARIYLHQYQHCIEELCNSFGIELVDPADPDQPDNSLNRLLNNIEQRISNEHIN